MRIARIVVVVIALISSAHQLPAPIQEITETPTPASKQSAEPKRKRTINAKAATETSKNSKKREMTAPQPTIQSRPIGPQFSGKWTGTMAKIDHTIVVDIAHNVMTAWQTKNPSVVRSGIPHVTGDTVAIDSGIYGTWSLTPLPDGQSARVRLQYPFFDSTAIFRRVSQ